jgi:hypothetical protein
VRSTGELATRRDRVGPAPLAKDTEGPRQDQQRDRRRDQRDQTERDGEHGARR